MHGCQKKRLCMKTRSALKEISETYNKTNVVINVVTNEENNYAHTQCYTKVGIIVNREKQKGYI